MALIAFEQLTRKEIGEIAPESVAILPTAAVEQHGVHAPVGLDVLCCVAVANAAAEAVGPHLSVVVCPPLAFGSSHHHRPQPGVMTLRGDTFGKVVYELLESLMLSGFRHVLVLNGHGGNASLVRQKAWEFILQNHEMHVVAGSYWDIARAALDAIPTPRRVWIPGHGGDFETALMLHLHPELIHRDRIPVQGGTPWPREPGRLPYFDMVYADAPGAQETGVSDDASAATAELGRQYFETAVAEVAKLLRSMPERG